jgi:two-component system sensor histidine kinase/response regulator
MTVGVWNAKEGLMTEATGTGANAKTILLIEDSATQALHLKLLLEQEGLEVAWASAGQMGLKMARQLLPDLILLDVQMPDMNGFQVCQQLRKADDTNYIPIIMLTRFDDPETVTLGMQVGVTDYIPKDAFADAVLLETLRQMGMI